MILENCKKRKRNFSCVWIDYKKAFGSVPHQWILRSFKVSPRIVDFLKHNMTNWKTQITLTYEKGTVMSDNINIRREIFQGDSLSPLLFCISLIPLSLELNSSSYGYKIGTERITYLFYMDDLKLYAKDYSELEGLLRIVKGFSYDIGMEFGFSKCAKATFKRGKLEKSDHARLDEETMIKDLEQEKVYNYLGIDESRGIQHATVKQKLLKKELVRRTRLILKTEVNSKNSITAINTLAIPVITYSFNIIDWNISEAKRLDIKVRKRMTTYSMHHPKTDIHRLYLQRSNRGRGLTQLELSYKSSTIGLFRYLNLSDDWMLRLALKHEKKKFHTQNFARKMDLDLETEFDG